MRIGLEAAGDDHRPLAHHPGQAGFGLKFVSSAALAHAGETLHNSWDKNELKDAQVIPRMRENGAVQYVLSGAGRRDGHRTCIAFACDQVAAPGYTIANPESELWAAGERRAEQNWFC